jgi:hypothetical protein
VYTNENANIDVGVGLGLVLTLNRIRLTECCRGQPEQSTDQGRQNPFHGAHPKLLLGILTPSASGPI